MQDFFEEYASQFGFSFGIRQMMVEPSPDFLAYPCQPGAEFSEAEIVQSHDLRCDKRRREWLAGRLAAKDALYQLVGSAPAIPNAYSSISILNGADRAPYIEGHPHLQVSISHSHQVCVAVVCTGRIGIDLEWIEPHPQALADRFFCQAEQAELRSLCPSALELGAQITRTWTRKEAVAKFMRLGGQMDFKSLDTRKDFIPIDQSLSRVIRLVSGQRDGYWITLAIQEPQENWSTR